MQRPNKLVEYFIYRMLLKYLLREINVRAHRVIFITRYRRMNNLQNNTFLHDKSGTNFVLIEILFKEGLAKTFDNRYVFILYICYFDFKKYVLIYL